MEIDFSSIQNQYRQVLVDVGNSVNSKVGNDKVKIVLGDHYHLNNTPLYLVLELHVAGMESEDDYGLCCPLIIRATTPQLKN